MVCREGGCKFNQGEILEFDCFVTWGRQADGLGECGWTLKTERGIRGLVLDGRMTSQSLVGIFWQVMMGSSSYVSWDGV
mgnify:CR=1 FL=1